MTNPAANPLQEQLEYYRARASEYDQWWLRSGRYDRGAELNARWFAEADQVVKALESFRPVGRVLELACGTGIWTEQLSKFTDDLTALDGSPEMLALNAARLGPLRVRYLQADIFQWTPAKTFDTVFFGFWLSHVPPEEFDAFWRLVRTCLAPGGRVFFVDSRYEHTSTAVDHRLPKSDSNVLRRRLNDGREFQIYKIFYESSELVRRLRELGWEFYLRQTDFYFLYGSGSRPSSR